MMQDQFLAQNKKAFAARQRKIKLVKVINWISIKITGKPSAFIR